VQPGIEIDYLTGDNRLAEGAPADQAKSDTQDGTSQAVSGDGEGASDDRVIKVVLNTNEDRKRIHMADAGCVETIKPENRSDWTGTADELKKFAEENGYVPCGTCHPEKKLNIDLPKRK
jgi:DNA-entry nuclease